VPDLDLGPLGTTPAAAATNGRHAEPLEDAPVENLEAEEAVLGALLLAGSAGGTDTIRDVAAAGLASKHFARESNGLIYTAIRELADRGEPHDPISVLAELEQTGRAKYAAPTRQTAKQRIQELAGLAPAVSNAAHWARLVIRSYRARTGEDGDEGEPLFMDAHAFVEMQVDTPAPLWGSARVTLIPAGGLVLFAGRPGVGKTTFLLDLLCHLAAGIPYPPRDDDKAPVPHAVDRPVRVALIENEGPREMFRDKLADKLDRFAPEIPAGHLLIQTLRWGSFSFADDDAFQMARAQLDEHQIDLVVGDPLGMLGVEGVGSPADTRTFVQILRGLGLGTTRAFMFLHHFRERVERSEDELAKISGAWGGHLDTLVTLSAMADAKQARLAFPKIRWAKDPVPDPIILGRVYAAAAFEALGTEGDLSLLVPLLAEWLENARSQSRGAGGKGWFTYSEIAKEMGRRRADVGKALEDATHLFAMRTGEDARALGKKTSAKLWGLVDWDDAPADAPPAAEPEPEQQTFGGDDDIPF
jgi:hypothetical protein